MFSFVVVFGVVHVAVVVVVVDIVAVVVVFDNSNLFVCF